MAVFDLGEPAKDLRKKFDARIKFASAFRIEHHRIPTDAELDFAVPLTKNGDLAKQMDSVWQKRNLQKKQTNDGVFGIEYDSVKRKWVARIQSKTGRTKKEFYPSAIKAAKRFNHLADQEKGVFAVYCDLEAAKRLDERMAAI